MTKANAMFTIVDTADVNMNGRNLVLKSHEEHSRTVSSSGANSVVPYYSYSNFASEFTHRKGQILTVSFDYETTGNTLSTGHIYAQHNESQISTKPATDCLVYILDNPSGHYSKTFTVTTNQSTSEKNTIRIYYKTCSPGTVIKIKNIKVEIGDEETPWTPAPEDITTAISDANEARELAESKNSVYYQTTAPTGTLKVGDTWFDTGNGYKISRWNGSNWVAAELGDAAFANISASKITAGIITSDILLSGTIELGGEDVDYQNGKIIAQNSDETKYVELVADNITMGPMLHVSDISGDLDVYLNSSSLGLVKNREYGTYFTYDNIIKSGINIPIEYGDAQSFLKWKTFAARRQVKDTLYVTIYYCGNMYWAHFDGTIPAGWNGTINKYINITPRAANDALFAPPATIEKYIIPQTPTTARPIVRVNTNGTIGLYAIVRAFDSSGSSPWTTVADNMETCDIFWAHVQDF